MNYIEDIFIRFCSEVEHSSFLSSYSSMALPSFKLLIENNSPLTEKQKGYILKILSKEKYLTSFSAEIESAVAAPIFKSPTRVIDQNEYIDVIDIDGYPHIFVRVNYPKKNFFFREIETIEPNAAPFRKDDGYAYPLRSSSNLLGMLAFSNEHSVDLREGFVSVISELENAITEYQEKIPCSYIKKNKVIINSTSKSAIDYFRNNSTGNLSHDMLLAKRMGYPLKPEYENVSRMHRLCSIRENRIHSPSINFFFEIFSHINKKAVLVLDRSQDDLVDWVENFIEVGKRYSVTTNDIVVCSRENNKVNPQFNQWIKKNNLGGKVDNKRIYIFTGSIKKWIYSKTDEIGVVGTTHITPSIYSTTLGFLNSFPLTLYLTLVNPVAEKGSKIAKL